MNIKNLVPKIVSRAELNEIAEENENMQKACTQLNNENAELKEQIKTLTEKQAGINEEINLIKKDYEKQIEDLKINYEKQILDLSEKVKLAENSSESKAINTLSQIGITTSDKLPEVKSEPQASILDIAATIGSDKLSEFFMKNKEAIFKEINKNKGK